MTKLPLRVDDHDLATEVPTMTKRSLSVDDHDLATEVPTKVLKKQPYKNRTGTKRKHADTGEMEVHAYMYSNYTPVTKTLGLSESLYNNILSGAQWYGRCIWPDDLTGTIYNSVTTALRASKGEEGTTSGLNCKLHMFLAPDLAEPVYSVKKNIDNRSRIELALDM